MPNTIHKPWLVPKFKKIATIEISFFWGGDRDNWSHPHVDSMVDNVVELMLFFLGVVMVCGYMEMCPFEKVNA